MIDNLTTKWKKALSNLPVTAVEDSPGTKIGFSVADVRVVGEIELCCSFCLNYCHQSNFNIPYQVSLVLQFFTHKI